MLDLIYPVHRSNFYLLAQRRIVEHKDGTEGEVFEGAMPFSEQYVDVPHRIIVSAEGGSRSDLATIESWLNGWGSEWKIVHNAEVTSWDEAMMRGLAQAKNKFVAVIPPWFHIKDKRWFGKMQAPFNKDNLAMLAASLKEPGKSFTIPPFVLDRHKHPQGPMFVTRLNALQELAPIPPCKNWLEEYSANIQRAGGRRWEVQSVGFELQEHEEHRKPVRKRRVSAARVESPE